MCPEEIVVPRGMTGFSLAKEPKKPADSRSASAKPAAAPVPPAPEVDLGALRKAALEEGRAQERKESGEAIMSAAQALQRAAAAFEEARKEDRSAISVFAVDLACMVADSLIGGALAEDQHHVDAIVSRILAEVLPESEPGEMVLEGHPDDLRRLPPGFSHDLEGVKLCLVPDSKAQKGTFRIRANGLDYVSSLSARLSEMKDRLHREAVGHARPS